jgi:chemotaxis signal transduction protein
MIPFTTVPQIPKLVKGVINPSGGFVYVFEMEVTPAGME